MNQTNSKLPNGWVSGRLEEIARLNPRHSSDLDPSVEVSFIPMPAVNEKGWKLRSSQKRPLSEVRNGYTHFAHGDVLFAKITPCMENGKAGVAEDLVNGLGCGTTELHVIRPCRGIESKFLYYFIHREDFRKVARQSMTGTAGQLRVPLSFIKQSVIPVPPATEQIRIVAKLEKLLAKVDACKERLEKIPAILKRFRQSVLAAAFGGILTSDWRSSNTAIAPAAHLLKEIEVVRLSRATTTKDRNRLQERHRSQQERVENPSSEPLPNTWTECTIGSIGDVQNGSTPSRKNLAYWNGKIPWVSSGEVRNTEIFMTREQISEDGFKNSSVRWLPSGTVLLAMIGEGKTRGQSAILRIKATINQNIAAVVTDHGLILSKYLWYWFQYQYSLTRLIGSGSGPKALNCQLVRCMPLNLAPLEEQHEIVRRVEALFKIADDIEKRYEKAKAHVDKLTQSILAKAFRGELVPQDPNDEPASELLKRIQEERKNQKAEARPNRKSTSRRVKN